MKRRLVLLSAAVLLALAGTAAVLAYVASADQRALEGTKSTEVLVAATDIPEGTPLTAVKAEGMVQPARFPVSSLPPDALTSLDGVGANAVTTRRLGAREIVLSSAFGTNAAGDSAAGLTLPPGTSAVPVSLKSFTKAEDWSGWIKPGAEIAVYQTFRTRNSDAAPYIPGAGLGKDAGTDNVKDHEVTRLLLDRVTVLAVGNGASASGGSDSSKSSDGGAAVVLALTQEQSERLIMGLAREAPLYPALLSPDSRVAPSPGTIDNQIFDPMRGVVRP